MKLGHYLCGFLMLCLLIAGVFLIWAIVMSDLYFSEIYQWIACERAMAIGSVFVGLLLTLIFSLSTDREMTAAEFISYDSDGGAVSISVSAVRDFIKKVGDEFADVLTIHPVITVKGGGVIVRVDVRVKSGTHVPELCRMLQTRVRESIREQLGLDSVREVRVNVREIVGSPSNAIAAQDEIDKRTNM